MGYDSCPPLYNAYEAKILCSKFCKEKKKEWSHYLGQPAPFEEKWSIFTGDQPTHSHLPWSIFMSDLPTHIQSGPFSGATNPHTQRLPWSIFMGDLPKWKKEKSGLIVMSDLPRWKNGLIVMGDLPR